ncbi:MAG: Tol-Pal system beta propeller repeat protein TolB [Spongiibacter sp.]|uniref:Tol-Pal system protein TolB n=1 Tax=Spongiibacter thalassae TaxID=2721624 RepID=A0ABX1GCN5_9GAMM|nr:Tol-Pal system beta propeller repeat protein TolB [Spongiibacter thalassae]NKI16706.1 Tol-Pal system protein TolB [Spongiibacter thalassae]
MLARLLFLGMILTMSVFSHAELTIEINKGNDDPLPIAVVPFGWKAGVTLPEDVGAIIERDLHRSGLFDPLSREDMLSRPSNASEVYFRDWKSLGVDYVVVGELAVEGGTLVAKYELLDVNTQRSLLAGTETQPASRSRFLAHTISDMIYEKLTNIRGAFRTELLYVSAVREGNDNFRYRLLKSDIDGANEVVLVDSKQPILAPTWAPDGQRIAYVSFETTRPAIYLHNLVSNERKQLTNFRGLNGAPAFSPDGNKLAMVLSKDGSPDVYVMDLSTQALQRVTNHFAIDTEPAWAPDGKSLFFTSDRGGKPQIYKVELATGYVERVTFEGDYNARARVLGDGLGLVMVHRVNGNFHIAVQDFKRKRVEILTSTELDESPSVAPNGSMMLYATKHNGQGVLAAVSVDGGVKYRLPSRFGDVREPAWSPYLY